MPYIFLIPFPERARVFHPLSSLALRVYALAAGLSRTTSSRLIIRVLIMKAPARNGKGTIEGSRLPSALPGAC